LLGGHIGDKRGERLPGKEKALYPPEKEFKSNTRGIFLNLEDKVRSNN